MILSISLILAVMMFLQLFFTVLLIAMAAGRKPTVLPDHMVPCQQHEIPVSDQLAHNCRKYAFTSREVETFLMLREGLPYKLIADRLNISQRTVSSHVANMFDKVSVTNKMELVSRMNPLIQIISFTVRK
ncbi:MAG: helix-turn-helix transcriptional regulator [Cyclobacteriaceae bacterium]|nr:helix-turn-helix transcriptional regulator [Cyclobacteriaceae bacterium]